MSGVLTRNAVSDFFDAVFESVESCEPYSSTHLPDGFDRELFLYEWEQKLREAVMADVSSVIRPSAIFPPPLNGGGLFVRED